MNANGQTYSLVTNSVHSARDSQSGADSNQTAKSQLGSILGNLAGGGQLPSGSVYTFRLTSPSQPGGVSQ